MADETSGDPLQRGLRTERLLIQAYLRLPKWARVAAFFLVLLVLMYLAVKPAILNGELLVASASGGGFRAYDLGRIRTVVQGRSVLVEPDKDGLWGVPITNALEGVEVRISDARNFFHPIQFSATDVWLMDLVTIAYDPLNEATPFRVEKKRYIGAWRLVRGLTAALRDGWPGGEALAQTRPAAGPVTVAQLKGLVLQHFQVRNPGDVPDWTTIRDIARESSPDERVAINALLDLRLRIQDTFQVTLEGHEAQFLFDIPMEKAAAYLENLRTRK